LDSPIKKLALWGEIEEGKEMTAPMILEIFSDYV
jgi:hypothetical protein